MRGRRTAVLRKKRSGAIAARRLKFLLTADQTGIPPEVLAMLRGDICRVISRYVDVDASGMELRVRCSHGESPGEETADSPAVLYTAIPVRNLRLKGTIT